MRPSAAIFLLSVALAAGCRGGSAVALPPVSGGSEAQRALMREVLGRLQSTRIAEVRIRPAGREWKPFARDAVVVQIVAARGVHHVRGEWDAWLTGTVFAARSVDRGFPQVVALEGPTGGSRLADAPSAAAPQDEEMLRQ